MTISIDQLEALEQQILAEISPDQPVGENPRGEEDFEAVQEAMNELFSGREVAWDQVIELSSRLLTEKGKDLDLVISLGVALQRQHGWPGAVSSLRMMNGAIERYWDGLFVPARFRGKALKSFHDLLQQGMTRFGQAEPAHHQAFDAEVARLDEHLSQKFSKPPAFFGALAEAKPGGAPNQDASSAEKPVAAQPSEKPAAAKPPPPQEEKAPEKEKKPLLGNLFKKKEAQNQQTLLCKPIEGILDEYVIKGLLDPIAEDKPCGIDPRDHDSWDMVYDEVSKFSAMGDGGPDLMVVEDHSRTIWSEAGKDLQLFAYLGFAWTYRHRFPGMIATLEMLHDLLELYGKTIHPPRPRLRNNAVDWLEKQLTGFAGNLKDPEPELLQRSIQATEHLNDVLEKLELKANFYPLLSLLKDMAVKPIDLEEKKKAEEKPKSEQPKAEAKQEKAPEPQSAQPPSQAAQAGQPAAGAPVPDVAINEMDTKQLEEFLADIANRYTELDAANPTGYLLRRLNLWKSPPTIQEGNATMVMRPDNGAINRLSKMVEIGSWEHILKRVEEDSQRWVYWLDLQYYAAKGAAEQGYQEVNDVIEDQMLALLARMPGLENLTFKKSLKTPDGDTHMPFASDETKTWIRQLLAKKKESQGQAGAAMEAPVSSMIGGDGEDPLAEFRDKLSAKKDLAEALAEVRADLGSASGLTLFRMKLELASFYRKGGQAKITEAMVAELAREVEENNLAHWFPEQAIVLWEMMLDIAREKKKNEGQEWESKALQQLARIDVNSMTRHVAKKGLFG